MEQYQYPGWLETVAIISLVVGGISALIIVIHILRGHKQHMWIMNVVWPVTALYGSVFALYAYFTVGGSPLIMPCSRPRNGAKPRRVRRNLSGR